MRVFPIVLLSLALVIPVAYGQTPEHRESMGDKFIGDLVTSFNVGVDYFTTPFRIDRTDAYNLLRFGALTTVAVTFDEEAANSMRKVTRTNMLNGIMEVGRGYGDIKYALYLPAGLYVGGLLSGNDDVRVTGRQVFQALLYSGIVTQSLKWVIGRSRPDAGNDPMKARLFNYSEPIDDRMFSMPSGHSTAAFAVSTVLAKRLDNTYASIVLYGLASTTAISRIYHDRHWLSDVFVGAVIGTATGIFVTDHEDTSATEGKTSPFRVMPTLTGIQFEYTF